MEKRRVDLMDRMVNPPAFGERKVLCPPLTGVEDYMKYLADHREDYRRLFGSEDGNPLNHAPL